MTNIWDKIKAVSLKTAFLHPNHKNFLNSSVLKALNSPIHLSYTFIFIRLGYAM
jgi:hypothetical protein